MIAHNMTYELLIVYINSEKTSKKQEIDKNEQDLLLKA